MKKEKKKKKNVSEITPMHVGQASENKSKACTPPPLHYYMYVHYVMIRLVMYTYD